MLLQHGAGAELTPASSPLIRQFSRARVDAAASGHRHDAVLNQSAPPAGGVELQTGPT